MGVVGNVAQDWIASDARRSAWVSQRMPEALAERLGRKKVLATFRDASASVTAYRAFLDANGVDPATVKDFEDFRALPMPDKESYLIANQDRPDDLVVGGDFSGCHAVSRSSGTTGNPIYFPRVERQDVSAMRGLESIWVNFCDIDKRSTLLVICFDMGMWLAGEMCADVGREIAKKHGRITVATPGSDIPEALAVVKHLSPKFEQTLIAGYPPFLRQLVRHGEEQGIPWSDLDVSLMPSGEGYSEQWRSRMLEHLGREDSLTAVVGAFGSSEGHMVGLETPLSVAIRRLADADAGLRSDLYGTEANCYSLVQHSPMGLFIEIVEGEIVLTNGGAVPLIRYNTHDSAGSASFGRFMEVLEAHGYGREYLRGAGVSDLHIWQMPFLFSFGRQDCVSVDGVSIYVEAVEPAVLKPGMEEIRNWKLAVRERRDGRLRLAVLVELAKGVAVATAPHEVLTRSERYREAFLEQLLEASPDFRSASRNNPECLNPLVMVYQYGEGPFEEDLARIKQRHVYRGDLPDEDADEREIAM